MEKYNLLLILLAILFFNQSFSQKIKPDIKPDPAETTKAIESKESIVYCGSTYTNTTDDWITNVSFNTLNNTTGQEGTNSYGDYSPTWGTGVFVGNSYTLSVSFNSLGIYEEHVWAWIDWNNDEDFDDPGEAYDLGYGIDATLSTSITVPNVGYLGNTRMRIIEQFDSDPTPCNPHGTAFGETEDYYVLISFNNYCIASGSCDEYISSVEIYSNYSYNSFISGCAGYFDYANPSWWTLIPQNGAGHITVFNGNPYPEDQCGIWVDWNNDNDFYDSGESISVSGSPGEGPYTAFISPPPGTAITDYHVRTRIDYSATPDPCGITTFGEVEDFHISLVPEISSEWNGSVDNNWHNPYNWNTLKVPDATTDVIIKDVFNKCWVWAGAAYCNNITVEYGTGYDLRIWDKTLEVSGDMDFYGQLLMDHSDGKIIAQENVTWHAGSTTSIQANAVFEVHGDWNFQAGANVEMDDGVVGFMGSGTSMIRSYEENCYFNDVVIYKSSPDWASISNISTADLHIHGDLGIEPASVLYMYTPESVFLHGDLLNLGSFLGYDGTLVMNGDEQMIFGSSPGSTQLFNNLTISSTISTSILGNEITVDNYLLIESGQLISNDFTISVGSDWNNQVGPSAFDEGNGRVIFYGTSTYIYSDENFYILELDMQNPLDILNIDGPTVNCEQYDWTQGSISVREGGSFTAIDLIDDGIFGGWGIDNTGGTINISNYDGYVDLNGDISLTGGTMNVYGGTTYSYWPFTAAASIYMLWDAVLDFHDQGIYIYDSPTYTLTENILGGTIRTAGGFWGETNDFNPGYGTMEFYGSTDATIYTNNACYLNNVLINKSTKENTKAISSINPKSVPLIDDRSGKLLGNGTKSNALTLSEFLDINGNLIIDNGVLNSNGHNIQIAGDWANNVGDAGFIESTGWVTFDGANTADILTNEVFANLMLNKTISGTSEALEFAFGITVNVTADFSLDDGALEMDPYSILDVDGNLYIANEAGLGAYAGYNEIYVGGNWTNENTTYDSFKGFFPLGVKVYFDGNADQILNTNAPQEDFVYLFISKPGGNFRPNANIQAYDDMEIVSGDWVDNTAGLTHYFHRLVHIYGSGGYYPQGTTVFKGISYQSFQNDGGDAVFYDVLIDKTNAKDKTFNDIKGNENNFNSNNSSSQKGITVSLLSDMEVTGSTTIDEGTIDLNGNDLKTYGYININDGGELLVNAGSLLSLGFSLYVHTGGLFTASGVSGNMANIGNIATWKYNFEVNSGGSISATYANFSDMDMHGIEVKDGAYVDPANAFNNCNFYNGISSSFSAQLMIENDQILNINNINFHNNPYYSDAYNIYKSVNKGEVVVIATGGDFAGPLYEYDDYNRIHWTEYVHGEWTGNVSSDWFDPMNWGDYNVPGPATEVVIPPGTPNDPAINNSTAQCNSVEIQAGASLEVGNDELIVGYTIDIYGELVMNTSSGKLESYWIEWQSGSTDDITAGEIHVDYWYFQDGTNAQLGTGNTAFITSALAAYDADASFGNLEIVPVKSEGTVDGKGSYPVRISGYCRMQSGTSWASPGIDFIIDGTWEIEDGGSFNFFSGAFATCNSDFTLNGTLYLETAAVAFIHGMFNFASTGVLDIDDATFFCDHTLSSGWIDLFGDVQMTTGSVEFPDASISFAGNSTISGGTILAGRAFRSSPAGAYQPTGGTLELVGTESGHYLQIINGNYANNLLVNRSAPIGVHPGSPLLVQGNMEISSELRAQTNVITVNGDVGIHSGGLLNIDNGASLNLADNKWLNVNNGGTIELIGLPGIEAIISHTTGHYYFWVESGGTISAEHAIFEYMRIDGVYIRPGAWVDPAHSFNNCTFQNGISNGRLMTVYNTQDFTIDNAVFPANTWSGAYNVFKNSTPGNVTFINATGDFAGEAFESDPYDLIHWGPPELRLELRVYLEGPFNPLSNEMNVDIHNIIPLNQPFDTNPLADWYYTGSENVPFILTDVVDWVLIDLRDAASASSALSGTSIGKQAAFLTATGDVINLDGSGILTFNSVIANELFAVIWQRNHLGVLSAVPLVKIGGVYTYDFSTGAGQAYGGSSGHIPLSSTPVIWGMFSGDANGNGDIEPADKNNYWFWQAGLNGYLESDFNLDKQVNNQDKNNNWIPNSGQGSQIP